MTQVTSGGQSTTLAWDYNNKVTGITYPGGSTNSFVTKDVGNRISKTDSGGANTFLFDGASVFSDSRADYTQGGVTGLISERSSGVTKTYYGDQLGSTRGLTNSSQTVSDSREYDSFGLLIASSGTTPTPFGFVGGQGYQRDADSGLMLLGARYYDASIGRFISRDPIGYAGGLNLYGYCGNDPGNSSDPSGYSPNWWNNLPPWVRNLVRRRCSRWLVDSAVDRESDHTRTATSRVLPGGEIGSGERSGAAAPKRELGEAAL